MNSMMGGVGNANSQMNTGEGENPMNMINTMMNSMMGGVGNANSQMNTGNDDGAGAEQKFDIANIMSKMGPLLSSLGNMNVQNSEEKFQELE